MGQKVKHFNMENVNEIVGFGKYEYETLLWVIINDTEYLTWMYSQYGVRFSSTLTEFVDWILSNRRFLTNDALEMRYMFYLEQERILRETSEQALKGKIEKAGFSGLDSKLQLLDELVKQQHGRQQDRLRPEQVEWLNYIKEYFDSHRMEMDTKSGKLRWALDEKTANDGFQRLVYKVKTERGYLFLVQEATLKDDAKWHTKFTFLSQDKRVKYDITKNSKGDIMNLRNLIKKQKYD